MRQSQTNHYRSLSAKLIIFANAPNDPGLIYEQVPASLDTGGLGRAIAQIPTGASLSTKKETVQFSIVIPVHNEEDNLPELHRRLATTLNGLQEPYELIFIDDGSADNSLAILADIYSRDQEHVRVITLSRNFGHQPAICAGLDYAQGKAVIIMDADLQDPPEVLPDLIKKWRGGYQVVYAIRQKRKEHLAKRAAYCLFYRMLRSMSKIEIPLDSGDFGLMDRCVVDALKSLPESNRFMRGLRSWTGFRQIGVVYERDARFAGETKYSLQKLVNLALGGFISFSYLPLRLAAMLGFVISGLSIILATYYLIQKLTIGIGLPGFATTVVLVSFLGGVQLVTIGIVGEYIGHILDEVKHRPTYVASRVLGFEQAQTPTETYSYQLSK
ncbi:MAG: glycosyltransferase family 2 protein [Chloroflexi bacterium]|nr:glycosyltransferase family 2 protein [Chloroflexota bacterium]